MAVTVLDPAEVANRLVVLRSGSRVFVSTVKIPVSPETNWLLTAVCLNVAPQPIAQGSSIEDQADYFLVDYVWKYQQQVNKNKQDWLKTMRGQV
jgi:hypothetical protein